MGVIIPLERSKVRTLDVHFEVARTSADISGMKIVMVDGVLLMEEDHYNR